MVVPGLAAAGYGQVAQQGEVLPAPELAAVHCGLGLHAPAVQQ